MISEDRIGLAPLDHTSLHRHVNLKLAELGLPTVPRSGEADVAPDLAPDQPAGDLAAGHTGAAEPRRAAGL